jgi:hypothetical protein
MVEDVLGVLDVQESELCGPQTMIAATSQTGTFAAMQYTTVAAARLVIGGMIGQLPLTLEPDAPGVPVMPEAVDAATPALPSEAKELSLELAD